MITNQENRLNDWPRDVKKMQLSHYMDSITNHAPPLPPQAGATPGACTGRKLRRLRKLNIDIDVEGQEGQGISGSQVEKGVEANPLNFKEQDKPMLQHECSEQGSMKGAFLF